MDNGDFWKKVKAIEIISHKIANSYIFGNYPFIFKGRGEEFIDLREYSPGDDIRRIDWNATAKFGGQSNRALVKNFREERGLNLYFGLDISSSMDFGYKSDNYKRQKACEILACLMTGAIKNNDKVGLFLFTDELELFIRPKNYSSIRGLVKKMLSHKLDIQSKKTDFEKVFTDLKPKLKKKSILIVASDFFTDEYFNSLRLLSKEQEIIAIRVIDEREESLPDIGWINIEDEETNEEIFLNSSDIDFRDSFRLRMKEFSEKLTGIFKKSRIEYIEIKSHEKSWKPLQKFFDKKRRRMVI